MSIPIEQLSTHELNQLTDRLCSRVSLAVEMSDGSIRAMRFHQLPKKIRGKVRKDIRSQIRSGELGAVLYSERGGEESTGSEA